MTKQIVEKKAVDTQMKKDWAEIIRIVASCKTLQDFTDNAIALIGNPMLILDVNIAVVAVTEMEIEDDEYQYLRAFHAPSNKLVSDSLWRNHIEDVIKNQGKSAHIDHWEQSNNNLGHLHKTLSQVLILV